MKAIDWEKNKTLAARKKMRFFGRITFPPIFCIKQHRSLGTCIIGLSDHFPRLAKFVALPVDCYGIFFNNNCEV